MAMIKRGASISPVSTNPSWGRIKNTGIPAKQNGAMGKEVGVEEENKEEK